MGMGVGLAAVGAAVAVRLWYSAPAATHAGGALSPTVRELGDKDEGVHNAEPTLQTELQGLRIKELRDRAKQAALDDDAIDDALDSDDPKGAIVDVLLQAAGLSDALVESSVQATDDVSTHDDLPSGLALELRNVQRVPVEIQR